MRSYDVIVVGAGPSGVSTAILLRQKGLKVAIFEQKSFPRYQIGESLLPGSVPILKQMGVWEKLQKASFVHKPGALFHSEATKNSAYFDFENSLYPTTEGALQVKRENFDSVLLEHAKEIGVEVVQPYQAKLVEKFEDKVVINQSHTGKVLVRAEGIGIKRLVPSEFVENIPTDQMTAIFGYYKADFSSYKQYGSIIINLFYPTGEKNPSWSWCIPLAPEEASVGFVIPSNIMKNLTQTYKNKESLYDALLEMNPFILPYLKRDQPLREVELRHNFQRVAKNIVFDRELWVGDSAGFIDPVFSSGVHLGLRSAQKVASLLEHNIPSNSLSRNDLMGYQEEYQQEFYIYYKFIKLFYQKNIVEKLFLKAENFDDVSTLTKIKEMTAILSGNLKEPNELISMIQRSHVILNPLIQDIFEREI